MIRNTHIENNLNFRLFLNEKTNINKGTSSVSDQVAKFTVGQLIHHRLFEYRGVVIDVDPKFQGSADWYQKVAKSKPHKDRPWYHILVDGSAQRTYVAEQNMEQDQEGGPIHHADLNKYFRGFGDAGYILKNKGH
jgi:heat shock protein HspQ